MSTLRTDLVGLLIAVRDWTPADGPLAHSLAVLADAVEECGDDTSLFPTLSLTIRITRHSPEALEEWTKRLRCAGHLTPADAADILPWTDAGRMRECVAEYLVGRIYGVRLDDDRLLVDCPNDVRMELRDKEWKYGYCSRYSLAIQNTDWRAVWLAIHEARRTEKSPGLTV